MNNFDIELERLNNELINMILLIEDIVDIAFDNTILISEEILNKAKDIEDKIDNKEKEIENTCLKLIYREKPVAIDLRIISAVLKIITDLERIADQALDIIFLRQEINNYNEHEILNEMIIYTKKLFDKAITSFLKRDIIIAEQVIKDDELVDELFIDLKEDIISKKANNISLIDMLMIAKYLERIADHSTNIAEAVIFLCKG